MLRRREAHAAALKEKLGAAANMFGGSHPSDLQMLKALMYSVKFIW